MTAAEPTTTLPEAVRRSFWDVDPSRLSWPGWREFIIGRLLRSGGWDAIQWLQARLTPAELAVWLRAHRGGGLTPQRLRYWQLILDLPAAEVDAWIARTKSEGWATRLQR